MGNRDLFVVRPKFHQEQPLEVLRWLRDVDPAHTYNTLVWTKDPTTGKPLLCIAGGSGAAIGTPKHILVIDVESGAITQTLAGHGKGVTDLAVSPLSTNILASASDDYTIRLWNLDPHYRHQPCVAIFAGEGHRQPILACHFHRNGRWMLSSGLDTAVCLWAVPSLDELDRPNDKNGRPDPRVVYYPHFYSTEIHADYVDNVVFYGDLILSRSSKDQTSQSASNEILLWKIDGFDSSDSPPKDPPMPTPGQCTRSSFPHKGVDRGFQRLLTFDMPHTSRFYLRFGLFHQPGMRPVLAMGNTESTFRFWDLQKLEEGWNPGEAPKMRSSAGSKPKGTKLKGKKPNAQSLSVMSEPRQDTPSGEGGTPSLASFAATPTPAPAEKKYDLDDPFRPLPPHREILVNTILSPKYDFGTTQIAWSPDGTWMVGVGDNGMLCMFHRDKSVA